MMHGHEKSDPAIVAVKPANKVEQLVAEQSAVQPTAAEPVEPRVGSGGVNRVSMRGRCFLDFLRDLNCDV